MAEDKGQTAGAETDYKAEYEKLSSEFEAIKKMQSGSDKAYTETRARLEQLAKENEDLKKSRMDEKQRIEYEQKQKEDQLQKQFKEIQSVTLRASKLRLLAEKKLDIKWESFITGETEAEIEESINTLVELAKGKDGERAKPKTPPLRAGTTAEKHNIDEGIRRAWKSQRGR